jgi:hypothetical protein
MKTHASTITLLAIVLSGCEVSTLDLTPTSSVGTEEGSAPTSCSASDCASFSLSCSEGTATNVKCVLDSSPQFPQAFCTLTGECAASAVPTCSWTAPENCVTSGSATACSISVGGGGIVTVEVDPAGDSGVGSSTVNAYFDSAIETDGTTFGSCVYQANGADLVHSGQVGVPAPNPGTITVAASGFSVSSVPACDGLYTEVTTTQSIAPGALVSFAWSNPGDTEYGDKFPTSLPTVPAPHFATLASSNTLAASSPTVARATDLAVDWTVTGTPLAMEQVVVSLTQGTALVTCSFDASAGTGVVPADALLKLDSGSATYSVESVHQADDNDTSTDWDLRFVVQTPLATPTGTAKGTLALQ